MRGSPGGSQDYEIDPDRAELARFAAEIKAFDKSLSTALRKRLRVGAQRGVDAIKLRLAGGQPGGIRAGLIAGTKISYKTGVRTAGVSIVTTGAKLPPNKQAMVRAFDKQSWEHPVFGHADTPKVTQEGRPYFGSVLEPQHAALQADAAAAVRDALGTVRTGELHA